MTNSRLAGSYLAKARARLKMLDVLMESEAYSDVVREAQEVVELALKGMLRQIGVEPPKFHDVGSFLLENAEKFPASIQPSLGALAEISGYLRKERELSFYGDVDFIPTERYTKEDADKARTGAKTVVETAEISIRSRQP